MARANTPEVDETAVARESPVRRAHAAAARRHGRASAPGYLGVPLEEMGGAGREAEEAEEERAEEQSSEGGEQDESRPRTRTRSRSRDDDHDDEKLKAGSSRSGRSRGKAASGRRRAQPAKGGGRKSAKAAEEKGSQRAKSSGAGRSTGSKPRAAGAARGKAKGAAKRVSGNARKPGAAAGKKAGKAAKRGAAAAAETASKAVGGGSGSGPLKSVKRRGERAAVKGIAKEARHVAGGLAKQAIKATAAAAARGAAKAVRRVGEAGADAVAERARSLPIQRSVDVAVPVDVAWEQWMELRHIPEARTRVVDVERDGETLHGRLDGAVDSDWEAEIVDERDCESFAWRSTEGSDSAGLVTFHELSDRLTRVELNLDVRPLHLIEAASLALHVADRRAEAELRRFKNDAELLDPDIYEELLSENGSAGQEEAEG